MGPSLALDQSPMRTSFATTCSHGAYGRSRFARGSSAEPRVVCCINDGAVLMSHELFGLPRDRLPPAHVRRGGISEDGCNGCRFTNRDLVEPREVPEEAEDQATNTAPDRHKSFATDLIATFIDLDQNRAWSARNKLPSRASVWAALNPVEHRVAVVSRQNHHFD